MFVMKTVKTALFYFVMMALFVPAVQGLIIAKPLITKECTFKGKALWGKVRIVTYGEDLKIRPVAYGADLKVRIKDFGADRCGQWKMVSYGENLKIRFVDYGEDLKVQFVSFGEGAR